MELRIDLFPRRGRGQDACASERDRMERNRARHYLGDGGGVIREYRDDVMVRERVIPAGEPCDCERCLYGPLTQAEEEEVALQAALDEDTRRRAAEG